MNLHSCIPSVAVVLMATLPYRRWSQARRWFREGCSITAPTVRYNSDECKRESGYIFFSQRFIVETGEIDREKTMDLFLTCSLFSLLLISLLFGALRFGLLLTTVQWHHHRLCGDFSILETHHACLQRHHTFARRHHFGFGRLAPAPAL